MSKISPELRPSGPPPPLDPSLFQPTPDELSFLRVTVAEDDEEIRKRVLDVQQQAYDLYPYTCILYFHFTSLIMSRHQVYSKVIKAAQKGDTWFLDVGCMMGTDERKLILDGYPASNVAGCDVRDTFIKIGYILYQDADKCPIKFITGDICKVSPEPVDSSTAPAGLKDVGTLEQLKNSLTHIYAGALFHLFDEDTQYAIALRLASLLKRSPGGIIFGRHAAKQDPQATGNGEEGKGAISEETMKKMFAHTPESWVLYGGSFGDLMIRANAM